MRLNQWGIFLSKNSDLLRWKGVCFMWTLPPASFRPVEPNPGGFERSPGQIRQRESELWSEKPGWAAGGSRSGQTDEERHEMVLSARPVQTGSVREKGGEGGQGSNESRWGSERRQNERADPLFGKVIGGKMKQLTRNSRLLQRRTERWDQLQQVQLLSGSCNSSHQLHGAFYLF